MRNLDTLAAQTAQQIMASTQGVSRQARWTTWLPKHWACLQENGVYAATLFLYSRSSADAKIAPYVRTSLLGSGSAGEVVHRPVPAGSGEAALRFVTDQSPTTWTPCCWSNKSGNRR